MSDKFSFKPLTTETWKAFEKLFGPRGACAGCWCMTWRLNRSDFDTGKGQGNKNAIRKLVEKAEPIGVLAFHRDEAIGWCAVAPREKYIRLQKSRALKPVDDQAVWSISCFYVAKSFRRQGLNVKLIKEAMKFAAENGAGIIEAYPIEPKEKNYPDVFAWTGFVSPFISAGFEEVERHIPTRPILRYNVD
ncbi:MAG TPA: GNAT family N-acetyltransferase [Cyclobacteriaceae bacterium]|nr:GNAT family N-acetyltransferase [Cyclobacteriaceae bacterium]